MVMEVIYMSQMTFKIFSNPKILLFLFDFFSHSGFCHVPLYQSYFSFLNTCVLGGYYSSAASTWSNAKSLLQSRILAR